MATSIQLPPELGSRLDALSAKTGRSTDYYPREIVENGITELEDYYLAAGTLERVKDGRELVQSAKSVRDELGLGDRVREDC